MDLPSVVHGWTLFALLGSAMPYSILGVFPHHGLSHFMMFEPLMLELANRGHRVVVLSRFPRADKVRNYEDVDVSTPGQSHVSALSFDMFSSVPISLRQDMQFLYDFLEQTEQVYRTENFQKLWKSDRKFDLVMVESFNTRAFFSLAYRFEAALVTVSSSALMPWASYDLANPVNPSYIAALLSYNADRMNLGQRLNNACVLAIMVLWYELVLDAKSEELKRKYLGADIPPLRQLGRNASLVLVNTHFSHTRPRPSVPAVVDVGGLYLKPAKPLHQVRIWHPLHRIKPPTASNPFAFAYQRRTFPIVLADVFNFFFFHPALVPHSPPIYFLKK